MAKRRKVEQLRRCSSDYERERLARIAQNQARLAELGVQNKFGDIKAFFKATKRQYCKRRHLNSSSETSSPTPLRRSERLKSAELSAKRNEETLPAIAPTRVELSPVATTLLPVATALSPARVELSAEAQARRCNSKGRGSIYDSVIGICCHSCRQKKLCGEENCERCGNRDPEKACLGKTDCSVCHSSQGVFCRACLKVRYGEDIDKVQQNEKWICPHCSEEKGINPYWICNSSFCLKKRNITPTGVAIFKARKMGYESVAHYLADFLRKSGLSKIK